MGDFFSNIGEVAVKMVLSRTAVGVAVMVSGDGNPRGGKGVNELRGLFELFSQGSR